MKKGFLLTLEGPEGSGKSTHSRLLAGYLTQKGIKTYCTREPGSTALGEKMRQLLLSPLYKNMSVRTELLLYEAARAQHVDEIIIPALEKNITVICDRFYDATFAYQGYGREIDLSIIKNINDFAVNKIKPALTILLDIDVNIGLEKSLHLSKDSFPRGESDRIEQEDIEFHKRVREGYLNLARREPVRIKVVTVKSEISETQLEIQKHIDDLLRRNSYVV
ncbi:MAG: dTMP kinase [bacterium]|nr:dTMP kinase [bacterium]